MKIAFIGDLHIQQRPVSRIEEDWDGVIQKKLTWLNSLDVEAIVCTGDICTQRPLTVYTLLYAINHLRTLQKPLYTIVGNHDLVTESENIISLIPTLRHLDVLQVDDVIVWGVDWGSKVVPAAIPGKYNIYVMHELVVPSAEYEYMGESVRYQPSARDYDLVIVGHFHLPFRRGNVINPGVVFRCRRDEDIISNVVIFDTETKQIEVTPLPQSEHPFVSTTSTESTLDIAHLIRSLTQQHTDVLQGLLDQAPERLRPILEEFVNSLRR